MQKKNRMLWTVKMKELIDPIYDHLDLGNHNEQEFGPSTKW